MEFKSIFCAWVGGQCCKTYYNTWCPTRFSKMLRPWKQCCIKMLPDVGMMTLYPKCVLKLVNVDRVATMSRIHLLVPGLFVPVGFPCSYPWFQGCSAPSYICTCLCGKRFYYPWFCAFYGVQAAWLQTQAPCTMYNIATNTCPNMAVSIASLV